jgi:hypothetical protein
MGVSVKSKFDFSGIDINNIDSDKLGIGAPLQDCAVIANAFERGAHVTPTEAAIFATISRTLQNHQQLTNSLITSTSSYLKSPTATANQATAFGSQLSGTTTTIDDGSQALNLGTQESIMGANTGKKLLDTLHNCIPCDLRLMALLELHPNLDLLGSLDKYLKDLLGTLDLVVGLLNNVDSFGDLCSLLNSLSFMCIPDLQRIIATLMALFMLDAIQLDDLMGLLQGLIAPMFAPILFAITSLLDQFVSLVTNPLTCVFNLINTQLVSRGAGIPAYSIEGGSASQQGLNSSLSQLASQLQEATYRIQGKLDFYMNQVKALMGEMGNNDTAYLRSKMKLLQIVRMIVFVKAIITAIMKGHAACSDSGKSPELSELDNFFQNFLSPNSPFDIWIDNNGQMHLDERIPNRDKTLPDGQNVIQFEGEPLIDPTLVPIVEKIVSSLQSVRTVAPCKLEASVGDVERINQQIEELNQL